MDPISLSVSVSHSLSLSESGDINFKENLAHVPLPSSSRYFPSIKYLLSLGQDFLGNKMCLNDSNSVCTSSDNDVVESIPNADALQVQPPQCCPGTLQDVSVFNVDAFIRELNKSGTRMTA